MYPNGSTIQFLTATAERSSALPPQVVTAYRYCSGIPFVVVFIRNI